MNKHENAEIVVIGGGAVGTAVACYLARDGADVALVERGEYAWGSSRRCDGHAVTYDSAPGYFSQFCKIGQDMFPEISRELPCDIEFEPEGLGLLVDDERDMETVLANYEGKKNEGVDVTFWDRDELLRHEPHVSDKVIACLNFNGDAKLNPMRLCFGLAELARQKGAKAFNRTAVTGITVRNGAVQSVETSSGSIATKKVVLASGVWTPGLGDMVGVKVPIRPRQGQILVTERLDGLVSKNYAEFGYLAAKSGKKRPGVTPEMEQFGVAMVLEPSAAGTVLIGSSRRFVGMDTTPHPAVMQAIAQRAKHFFPSFSGVKLIRAYAGVRPASPDGKPIISPTHVEGVYVAAGHEGNGIGLSLITGKLVSQMLRGETPLVDLAPLCIDRFGGNGPAGSPETGMAPEAGQPEKPAALKPLAPAKAAFRQALAGGRPPSGGKRAGRPQQAPRNGNGARAAMPGQRTAEDRPERGVPLQGFPSLGSRPRDVPQTSSRNRFRHGNDSAGERFFHVQVRFSPPARTGHHHL